MTAKGCDTIIFGVILGKLIKREKAEKGREATEDN